MFKTQIDKPYLQHAKVKMLLELNKVTESHRLNTEDILTILGFLLMQVDIDGIEKENQSITV